MGVPSTGIRTLTSLEHFPWWTFSCVFHSFSVLLVLLHPLILTWNSPKMGFQNIIFLLSMAILGFIPNKSQYSPIVHPKIIGMKNGKLGEYWDLLGLSIPKSPSGAYNPPSTHPQPPSPADYAWRGDNRPLGPANLRISSAHDPSLRWSTRPTTAQPTRGCPGQGGPPQWWCLLCVKHHSLLVDIISTHKA